MQQPTEKEIEDAMWESRSKNYVSDNFINGFGRAVKWLLNWQKSQPLEVFLVRSKEEDSFFCICRTKEEAENTIETIKKTYENEFYFTSVII